MLAVLFVALVGLVQYLRPTPPVLVLEVHGAGGRVVRLPVRDGDRVFLSFQHSVERSPVVEILRVDAAVGLVLEETAYSAQGWGLPFDEQAQFSNEDGILRWRGLERPLPQLRILPSAHTAHTLSVGGTDLDLSHPRWAGRPVEVRLRYGRVE